MTTFLSTLVVLGLTDLNAVAGLIIRESYTLPPINYTHVPPIKYTLPPIKYTLPAPTEDTKPPPPPPPPTDDAGGFPENPDGAIFRTTLEDGTLIVTGFSSNQTTSPDGKPYPAEVHEHSKFPTQQPDSADDTHRQDRVCDTQLAPPYMVDKIGVILLVDQCRTVDYWITLWWVYWGNNWWPVMNYPWWGWHWYHWWYCLSSRCRAAIFEGSRLRFLCWRCRTEWGWKRVLIWYYKNLRWIWIRAPVGCCCDSRRPWWWC
ncbi:uncharacterized protein LOC106177174 [Lingula anatina]|uniref:Uncharacterized protein LOC106177174 n=1 Tax=Lingula anatina TaxID=7574 RepID=A0A1S3JY59_LINAN|nr:uncharacterized protein LOC106177174 [Lingula anatina]|eukprot:XP_013415318.1 uncharacterized protein LOC106177174 [Lingula anatina]